MMQAALPVPSGRLRGDEAEAFGDGSAPPETAEEYLLRVRAEAQRLPDVMIATKTEDDDEQRALEEAPEGEANTPGDLAPPTHWERSVLADFGELRVELEKLAARGVGSKKYERTAVPPMKDAAAWADFCFNESRKPTTSLILQFDAPMTAAVLGHHVRWACCEATVLTTERAVWLYALMAHLERPLHRDVDALLRRLVLRLLDVRRQAASDEDDNSVVVLPQLLLVIAGRYFRQATDAELDGSELPEALAPKVAAASGLLLVEEEEEDADESVPVETEGGGDDGDGGE